MSSGARPSPPSRRRDTRPATTVPGLLAAPPPDVTFDPPLSPPLAARPWEPRRKLPVPLVNVHTDDRGEPFLDFLGVDPRMAEDVGRRGLCGLCGQPLGTRFVFLGTESMPDVRLCSDPPMHEGCARDALRLCPHLRLRHHQPAPAHRLHEEVQIPEGYERTRPDSWVLAETDFYEMAIVQGVLVFVVGPMYQIRHFAYTGPEESLVETDRPPGLARTHDA